MKKIIFADDDPTIHDVINLIFEGQYDIEFYASGESLLENKFSVPDLFLLHKLSGADGLEICRFLKTQESTKHVPVIIISSSPSIIKLAREAGADDVIAKPFPIRQLREMVASFTTSNRIKKV